MSQDDFDRLLLWFGSDRDSSGIQYQRIHARLTRFFHFKGCNRPEDLADKVMDRIARKLPSFGTSSQDQIAICLGFARNVLHEHWRDEDVFYEGHDLNEYPSGENENALNEMRALCLENCLGRLGDDNKQLILKYHEYEPGGKIGHRKMMAEARHISLNALRLKACRLKSELTPCLKNCIQFGGMTKVQ